MSPATQAPEQVQANSAALDDGFPVDSFKNAAQHLRRPFTPQAVRFKVQATWDGGALVVPYIDARLAIERLNLVCPHLWFDRYEPTPQGLMWCHLTLDGITRSDVGTEIGQGDAGKKGLVSDAFKRAAVKFGIGVSLYAMTKLRIAEENGHLKKGGGKDKYRLTPNGETHCRNLYEGWLDTVGVRAFGDPLDHGDAEDAVGDAEVEAPAVSTSRAQAKRRDGQGDGRSAQATAAQRRKMHAEATRLSLTEPQFKAWIEWHAGTPLTDRIEKAKASKLIEMLESYGDSAEALAAFNAALEAEDEKAQKIAAKYSSGSGD